MLEKDLLLKLISDYDVNIILAAFGENTSVGKPDFKRMKVKKILNRNNTKSKKPAPFDFLAQTIKTFDDDEIPLANLILLFRDADPREVPYISQFFTIRNHYPDFYKEHYDEMVESVLDGRHFLDVKLFKTDEDLLEFFQQQEETNVSFEEFFIEIATDWHLKWLGSLDEIEAQVKDFTMIDFDQHFMKLTEEYTQFSVELAFLRAASFPELLRRTILKHCLNSFIEVKDQYKDTQLEEYLTEKQEDFRNKLTDFFEQSVEIKDQLDVEREKSATLTKELEQTKEESEKNEAQLISVNQELETKLKKYELLEKGYQWGLSCDYSYLGLVVFHASPLLYIEHVFPEITFLNELSNLEELNTVFPCQHLLIQRYGIPFSQKRQIQQYALSHGIKVTELDGREERELIMELSQLLKKLKK